MKEGLTSGRSWISPKHPQAQSHRAADSIVASPRAGIAKPEFKKHIHNAAVKVDTGTAVAGAGTSLSRRQLKNLAKRRKKEAAAAEAESAGTITAQPLSSEVTASKSKKAALDPGKKAEVNCNWQALKKALASGGPVIMRSVSG
jgi:hypothetical protein